MSLSLSPGASNTVSPLLPASLLETAEHELIAQAKAGSAEAFGRLIERYERRIFRLAQNITRNREDAEDVMQNALVKAFLHLQGFREDSRFYTWLVRITLNEALMGIRRRRGNEVSIDDSAEPDGPILRDELEDWGPSPEQNYSQRQMQTILTTTIRKLSPGDRIVFQLRDVEGLSTEETARALALSISAVKSRLQRARLRLRKSLSRYFGPRARKSAGSLLITEPLKARS
ncbi:MAG TPA: sigma-70 family RNA polymerase sigma factor [Candidatus Aquilonibacter sp.]|nr:sigma-70 family RNA polymerase sigma factor [Candidatus Aquilonibacter sp.]